ncbi:rhomboid family intramembrane serine protease GlpG [Colwellia sp. 1_MG-2023]|uniref:rhomboid family intramembrane serine protease GlpG n=1 Tax=Colwellia sp. 1_MG-2023 TaxID=3062649 RepID=UPI0026E3D933|nr:rhomboid family intramembrane serine protease GlpG [Colwellia sp. 1_MG-2023]MDO6445371.1 rhomboid family intramembrane serine protease GlpG [Colwellia sp. 1_MG-2023]
MTDSSHSLQPLVSVPQHNIALLFSNYLNSQNIASRVQIEGEQFVILCSPDMYEHAREMFNDFIDNPYDVKYQQAAWHSSETIDVVQNGPAFFTSFKQQFLAHAGGVTLSIFALCWLIYIGSILGWQKAIFSEIHFFTALSVTQFFDNPLRLIGPVFFHFSLLHIAFNTMWWWQLGGSIEKVMGKMELVQLFLLSAILSNLGQFIVSGPNFGGLSGVVYGVVGYVWWAGWLAPEKGLVLSKAIVGFLLFWLLLGFVDVLPVNMANTAHLLGLVSGCFLAWLRFANQAKGEKLQ